MNNSSDPASGPGPSPVHSPSTALERELVSLLPRLRAHLARKRGHGASELDDLVQEVSARALRSSAGFAANRDLWPWLRSIADRVRIDHFARSARAPESRGDLDPLDPRTEHSPADRHQERESVERLVAGLPPRERQALLRFHCLGQSLAEIALALGVPLGTVKSDLSRARCRLAEWHGGPDHKRPLIP